jgi:hypothetical protein
MTVVYKFRGAEYEERLIEAVNNYDADFVMAKIIYTRYELEKIVETEIGELNVVEVRGDGVYADLNLSGYEAIAEYDEWSLKNNTNNDVVMRLNIMLVSQNEDSQRFWYIENIHIFHYNEFNPIPIDWIKDF